ncbi:hypothetical protein [Pseudomonas sp. CGJS7]|uniref:hypothetical protein n=1 Tax=Pseudomonas sp. CGJS7 TaxID=3109348 RepID=UPI003008AFAC
MTLICAPQSTFSWNFSVSGLATGVAHLTLEPFSDQGAIAFGDTKLRVRKEGWINPCWTLERDGNALASAKTRGLFRNGYLLTCQEGVLLVRSQTPITRGYDILLGDTVIGVVEPEHFLTFKTRAKFEPNISDLTQLFSIWLITMTWRNTGG